MHIINNQEDHMETYLVVGGDVRNYYMAVYLKESGKNVYMYRTKFPSDYL